MATFKLAYTYTVTYTDGFAEIEAESLEDAKEELSAWSDDALVAGCSDSQAEVDSWREEEEELYALDGPVHRRISG